MPRRWRRPRRGGSIEDLDGYWSGGGTVVFSEGAERVKCAVRYKVGQGGTQIRQTLRCASADYSINGTAEFSVRGAQVDGNWEEKTYSATGQISGRLHGQQPRPVDQGREFHGGDDHRPLHLQAVDHHPPQGLDVRRISMSLAKCWLWLPRHGRLHDSPRPR